GGTIGDIRARVVTWPTGSGSAAIFTPCPSGRASGPCGRAALGCGGPAGCGACGRGHSFYYDVRPAQSPSATGTGTGDLIDGDLRHLRIGGGAGCLAGGRRRRGG